MSSENLLNTCKDHFRSKVHVKNKENTVMYTLSNGKISLKDNKTTFQQIKAEKNGGDFIHVGPAGELLLEVFHNLL